MNIGIANIVATVFEVKVSYRVVAFFPEMVKATVDDSTRISVISEPLFARLKPSNDIVARASDRINKDESKGVMYDNSEKIIIPNITALRAELEAVMSVFLTNLTTLYKRNRYTINPKIPRVVITSSRSLNGLSNERDH